VRFEDGVPGVQAARAAGALAAAVAALAAAAARRRELGERGRARVLERWTWDASTDCLEALLARARGRRAPARAPASR
jgi:beta-phosphoglucomutase-like phosphatase (HAD superfamily)